MQFPQSQYCNNSYLPPYNGSYSGCGNQYPIVPGVNPALQTWNGQAFVVADGSAQNQISLPFLKVNQGVATYLLGADNNGVWSYYNPSLISNLYGGDAGQVLYQVSPSVTGFTATGVSGQILTSAGTGTPTWQTNFAGNAATATTATTATKLATARTIATSGDITGTATSFDGSANITIPTAITNGAVTPLKLSTGGPSWDASGNLTATRLIAYGTGGLATNLAIGANSLESTTTGQFNVALGYLALQKNQSGIQNIAIGVNSLNLNTSGILNVAIGVNSLEKNNTGQCNTGIGIQSLKDNTSGSGNVMIGPTNSAGNYAPIFSPSTENNRVIVGSTSTTNAYCAVAWQTTSDARDKTNINQLELGLDFVSQLNPVSYQFRQSRDTDETNGGLRYGFLAQEVKEVEGSNPVIIDDEDPEHLSYKEANLIPILVKAIQELKAEIELLKQK